jgi:hypothetical protein
MARPRAADDFAAIRTRMEELRRERMEVARADADETIIEAHRRRSPAPIDEEALGPFRDRVRS